MKNIRTFALIIATLLLSTSISRAQFNTPEAGGAFTLNFIGTMPMGDFGKATTPPTLFSPSIYNFENCGNAVFGGGLGFKGGYQFYFGMGIFLSADAMWNQLNNDMLTCYSFRKKTKPNYLNFPILFGLDYKCHFGDVFGLYIEGATGLGLLYVTQEGWESNMTKYKLSTAFAYEGGLGILLGDHFSIGVHYYMCGKHKISIKNEQASYLQPALLKVDMLALKIGFMF